MFSSPPFISARIAGAPGDARFRRVGLHNAKVAAKIAAHPAVMATMEAIGFEIVNDDDDDGDANDKSEANTDVKSEVKSEVKRESKRWLQFPYPDDVSAEDAECTAQLLTAAAAVLREEVAARQS
jgi:hypothetical protein